MSHLASKFYVQVLQVLISQQWMDGWFGITSFSTIFQSHQDNYISAMDGWMVWGCTSFSTIFQSHQDNYISANHQSERALFWGLGTLENLHRFMQSSLASHFWDLGKQCRPISWQLIRVYTAGKVSYQPATITSQITYILY